MARKPKFGLEETNDSFTVTLPKPSLKYVDFFLSLDCVATLAGSGFFPTCKEITETMAVFEAARNKLGLSYSREDVLAVAVGDGVWPRTALYVAYMSKWKSVSVDPLLRVDHPKVRTAMEKARRLELLPQRVEDVEIDASGFSDVVFLFVHSHASLHAAVSSLRGLAEDCRVHAVSMPCCFGDDLGLEPSETFEDPLVLSVKRTLQIYRSFPLPGREAQAQPSPRPGRR
jgi:hypothetical protein